MGIVCTKKSFSELPVKADFSFFLSGNYLSVEFLITTESENFIYACSLLTVAIMKMHLFFFWILLSLAITTSPGERKKTKKQPQQKSIFVSGMSELHSLNHTMHKKPEQS